MEIKGPFGLVYLPIDKRVKMNRRVTVNNHEQILVDGNNSSQDKDDEGLRLLCGVESVLYTVVCRTGTGVRERASPSESKMSTREGGGWNCSDVSVTVRYRSGEALKEA
jgi:hypothetical protein